MNNMSKSDKKKLMVVFTSCMVIIASVVGYTYSYFSATVTNVNNTNTVLKSNKLSLNFKGQNEVINCTNIVPGDKCIKTFDVENESNIETYYNIFIENITNTFNSDLVYTLKEGSTEVITETVAPVTKNGKTYIKSNITIPASPGKHSYTLTFEFKYSSEDQNTNQGAQFIGTVGIDTEQRSYEVDAAEIGVSLTLPEGVTTECTGNNATADCMLNELYDKFN